jgi:hypothetical protein
MFINAKLADERLMAQDLSSMLMFLAVVLLPILVIWMVFGYVNQFLINRGMNKKQNELLTQLQKNQDYTDLVVRVMLDAEHEIKDGFVLNKFDMFITDMNEALGEIIQRCNIASSAQLDQLWQRVRRGERWTLGKAILDASKNQSTFNAWVKEKVGRDNVFRGSLLEFCSRYQNLLQLLEKHDRDRIFVRMIESGVFGKVYSIIAPMSDGIGNSLKQNDVYSSQINAAIQKTNEYTSALKLATMEEPKADESIMNVDRDDDSEYDDEHEQAPKESFFSRINPFRKKEEPMFENNEDDPFFQALHNSFNDRPSEPEPDFSSFDSTPRMSEPQLSVNEVSEPKISATPAMGQLRETLNNLRMNNTMSELTATRDEPEEGRLAPMQNEQFFSAGDKTEPSLNNMMQEDDSPDEQEEKEEDLVYPFGGWTDESNYGK